MVIPLLANQDLTPMRFCSTIDSKGYSCLNYYGIHLSKFWREIYFWLIFSMMAFLLQNTFEYWQWVLITKAVI